MGCGSSSNTAIQIKAIKAATATITPERGAAVGSAPSPPKKDGCSAQTAATAASAAVPAPAAGKEEAAVSSSESPAEGFTTGRGSLHAGGRPVSPSASQKGASAILPRHVSADELGQLCQATNFDRKQVERLYENFKVISASGADDGFIDKAEFEAALGLRSSIFVDRIFKIFDGNNDGNITFEEFVIGLSTFSSRASRDSKAAMSFRIHDVDGDGMISRDDLGQMVRATIRENMLNIPDAQFEELISATFAQAGCADKPGLSMDDFLALVKQRPAMLANMTILSISVSK